MRRLAWACVLIALLFLSSAHGIRRLSPRFPSSPPPCFQELASFSVTPSSSPGLYYNVSRVTNPSFNVHPPPFVVLPRSVEEVQVALRCAAQHGVHVSVKNGGHSFEGYSTTPVGFMMNMERLCQVEWIDDAVIRVGVGCRWRDVYAAFREHGGVWVVTGGLCPSVGVTGFTLGGGVGPTARQFGLAIDNVLEFQMVTSNGSQVVQASPREHQDLYWALRGSGGGNFGVVTQLVMRVFRGPNLYAWGKICYEPTLSAQVMKLLFDQYDKQSRSINIDLTLSTSELCLWVISQHSEQDTKAAVAAFWTTSRFWREFDCFWEMIQDYADEHGYAEYSSQAGLTKTVLVDSLSAPLLKTLASSIKPQDGDCDLHFIQFGGATADLEAHETAFTWRNTKFMVYFSCGVTPATKTAVRLRMEEWYRSVKPFIAGSYVNFIDSTLPDWANVYYGSNLARLQAIKEQWSPVGMTPLSFRQEIPAP
ncbi:Glucooligosaccharide oxidase [Balamuthia mandrillaris]